MKKNRYTHILKILKSEKTYDLEKTINETPTNNTTGVYTFKNPKFLSDIFKKYDELDNNYLNYWNGGNDLIKKSPDFTQNYLLDDPSGKSTSGLISDDGTVFSKLPPGAESFILGPIVDCFVLDEENNSYTNIGYIQKDTRQFVLLAKIDGQWKNNLNGNHSVWDGTLNGLTIYNQKFTLEMAQWIKECVINDEYVKDVPYFYSGKINNENVNFVCPNCPPNMYGGNAIGLNDKNDGYAQNVDNFVNNSSVKSKDMFYYQMGQRMSVGDMSTNEINNFFKNIEKQNDKFDSSYDFENILLKDVLSKRK